jgi:hypothetical protein
MSIRFLFKHASNSVLTPVTFDGSVYYVYVLLIESILVIRVFISYLVIG